MSQKKCLYELLGLSKNCSQEEIRYAYKKLALQLHPDKLIQTGIPEDQATAGFQELINAYEVLSDPRERAWYDSHREQILFASSDSSNVSGTPSDFIRTQNIWSYFSNSVYSGYDDSGKGFFKVYGDVFAKLFDLEVAFAKKIGLDRSAVKESPLMGNLESHYSQVSAFYGYWLGFATVMDFSWVDQYHASEGPNRKARRVMEEENKKLRKKARREYNEMVRGLAEFVRKRDKRVIDWQLQKNLEKKKKEEAEILRRKEEKRARLEKAMLYEEPNWAITNEIVDESDDQDELEKEAGGVKNRDGKELYCIVCSKKFKSEKQWKNHEQSKKHRDKLAELRDVHMDDEEILEDDRGETHVGTDELCSEIEETPDFQEEETNAGCGSNWGVDDPGDFRSSSGDEEEIVITDVKGEENSSDFSCIHEETDILEAMIDHNTTKDAVVHEPDSSPSIVCSPHSETPSFMKSNARKNNPRNRESKKESGTSCNAGSGSCSNGSKDAEDVKVDLNGSCDDGDSAKPNDGVGVSHMQETDVNLDDLSPERKQKPVNQPFDKKASGQNEANAKRKISSKGKKQKGTSKISGHLCETCGESFDSRNKLFGHLSGTGHAVLKSR